jgi:YidC/Oxa1 family membrane protein insertase
MKKGMDRTSWLAAGVCLLLLILYPQIVSHFYPPDPNAVKKKAESAAAKASTNAPVAAPTPATMPQLAAKESLAPGAVTRTTPEQTAVLENNTIRAVLTTWGGGVKEIELKEHEVEEPAKVVLNRGSPDAVFELRGWTSPGEDLNWTLEKADAQEVVLSAPAHPDGSIVVRRTFRLAGDYLISLDQTLENRGGAPFALPSYALAGGVGSPIHLRKDEEAYVGTGWFTTDLSYTTHKLPEFLPSNFLFLFPQSGKDKVASREDRSVRWIAAKSQFFAMVLTVKGDPATGAEARKVELSGDTMKDGNGKVLAVETWLKMPGVDLAPAGQASCSFTLYAGPKEDWRLRGLASNEDYVMEFGWMGWVSRPLLAVMNWIHKYVGSYGWSIVILTILIKGVLWYPQAKANLSMKKMQLLAPKLKELQEKYKEEPAKLNTEMMKLYKDFGVNPLGGCLPLLIQMPVFLGFYYMLLSSVELRGQTFFWIHDLSRPDTVFVIPGLGLPINPMPLIMTATMMWSMHITPQPQGVDNPAAKMMKWMPLLMLVFCYNFSSALSLYWTVQNLLSIVQLYYNLNQPMPKLEKVVRPIDQVKRGRWKGGMWGRR